MRQQGFTLIELLVVLGIIGAVLAVALPSFSRQPGRRQLVSSAHEIASTLREARSQALATNRSSLFHADLRAKAFWTAGGERRHLSDGIAFAIRTVDGQALADAATIRFFPDGSSTGGGVTLSARDLAYEVQVDWLDGGVSIREQADERH